MRHKKTANVITLIAILIVCFIPFVFSSGCMFDPGTETIVSDSATFRINGKVYSSDSKALPGINVSLFDSVNSIRSLVSITDTNGSFTITFSYIKQSLLYIDLIVPNTLSASYVSKRDTLHFDDNYFRYDLTKYYETTLSTK